MKESHPINFKLVGNASYRGDPKGPGAYPFEAEVNSAPWTNYPTPAKKKRPKLM